MIKFHIETIICPECGKIQPAVVEHTWPFYSYVHECHRCHYTIMESEWNTTLQIPAIKMVARLMKIVKGGHWWDFPGFWHSHRLHNSKGRNTIENDKKISRKNRPKYKYQWIKIKPRP